MAASVSCEQHKVHRLCTHPLLRQPWLPIIVLQGEGVEEQEAKPAVAPAESKHMRELARMIGFLYVDSHVPSPREAVSNAGKSPHALLGPRACSFAGGLK